MRQLTDYIKEYPNILSDELCDEMISRFDKDDRLHSGVTLDGPAGYKRSTDLFISPLKDWKDVDEKLYEALSPRITDYLQFLKDSVGFYEGLNLHDTGYQIQKTSTGEFYKWHSDHMVKGVRENSHYDAIYIPQRIVTYIFYLNDNFEGGETQFFEDYSIGVKPEKGKLILFPANPIWMHQGAIVTSGEKYITTGWLYSSYMAID